MRADGRATRDHLAGLLWSEDESRAARHNLRQALLELRRELGPVGAELIRAGRDDIGLDKTAFEVDVLAFEKLAWSTNPADHARAVSLCDGAFLDGLAGPSRPFEDWLVAVRERLRLLALPVFEKFAAAETTGGQDAVAAARRLLAVDPLDEAAQRLLLRTLATRLSREAALVEADRITAQLQSEFAASPEPETLTLIASIRDGRLRPIGGDGGVPARALPAAPARARPVLSLPSWQTPRPIRAAVIDKRTLETQGVYAVVVLPFASSGESPAPLAGELAEALSDDLICDLSHTQALRVISSHTANSYGGAGTDLAALDAELGVHYAIEGSLRAEGDLIRVNLGLTDVRTRLRIWSETVATPGAEYLANRQAIARGLAYRIFSRVLTEQAELVPDFLGDPAIEHLIAKGWAAQIQIGLTGFGLEAGAHFERVLAREPDNLAAMIGLGGFKAMKVITFTADDPEATLNEAEPLLRRAIERNPYAAIAHHYLGLVEKARGRAAESVAALNRAVEINPSFAPAYGALANMLGRMGQPQAGIEHALYALRLSPRDASAGIWWLFAGEIQLELGQDDLALGGSAARSP